MLLAEGRLEAALAEALEEPDDRFGPWSRAIVQHAAGHAAESLEELGRLVDLHAHDCAYQIAEVHSMRGELEDAFA